MKYEVIGWTSLGDEKYPLHEPITASVDFAIIKEIRKHGYLFGGDAHKRYCPVLNDGTYVSYSWRGWGRIIALAYEEEGEYAYMYGYMDELIKPSAHKYPKDKAVEDIRIVPKESITETFIMHLADDMFEKVKAGTKTVEVRLFDDKRKLVDVGDYIEFHKKSDENELVIRKVVDIPLIQKSFKEMFKTSKYLGNQKWKDVMRFSPESLGAQTNSTIKSLVNQMYKYYDKSEEEKYGVVAFILEEPKPACYTIFKVLLNGDERINRYYEKLVAASDEEFYRLMDDSLFDSDKIADALKEIAAFKEKWDYFSYGENNTYQGDLNEMLRKTLTGLIGKEEQLKAIQDKYLVVMQLEIFEVIVNDSNQPKQHLSLDKDITEFLDKLWTKLKYGYKVI